MGGSAFLDPDVLVDSLVPDVIDGLREELHPPFGVRAYRTYVVRRTWAGSIVGDGAMTEVVVELRPQPLIREEVRWDWMANGGVLTGQYKLTEVSLTYGYDELAGSGLGTNEQWLYRIDEAHGQRNPPRYFALSRPPFVDRVKDMGWVIHLSPVQVEGCGV